MFFCEQSCVYFLGRASCLPEERTTVQSFAYGDGVVTDGARAGPCRWKEQWASCYYYQSVLTDYFPSFTESSLLLYPLINEVQ